jgi:hypothetical protein
MIKAPATVYIREADNEEVKDSLPELKSFIGHESTATLISEKIGGKVSVNRSPLSMGTGDSCYIFQLLQRLPEGTVLSTEELKQIPSRWFKVSVLDAGRV